MTASFCSKQNNLSKSRSNAFGKLKELSESCRLGRHEGTFFRDLFIAIMQDTEFQNKVIKGTVDPVQALRRVFNIKLGTQNQLQMSNSQSAPKQAQYSLRVNSAVQIYDPILSLILESGFRTAKIVALLVPEITETNVQPEIMYAIIMVCEATLHVFRKTKHTHQSKTRQNVNAIDTCTMS